MDELDADSQLRREVFALYGLAMYHAQCFEKSLVILVSMTFNKKYLSSPLHERDVFFDESFKKTAGALVKRLKEKIKVPETLEVQLVEAVHKRNWLAHDYFWNRAGELLNVAGNEKMVGELTDIYKYFDVIDKRLVVIYEKWAAKLGITEEVIQKMMKEYEH
ncbi:MAG: hypothetical protein HGA87_02080 [Desulfobulbaceae bacterium]|nr:hypothetical protein [Desulfobulbaceae bacterium]